MADLKQAFLYDAFNMYYDKGMEARAKGNDTLARTQLLKAAETLLKLAAYSAGDLKRARVDRAMRLYEIAQTIGGQEGDKTERGETLTRAKTDARPSKTDEDLTAWKEAGAPAARFEDVAGLDEVKESVYNRIILPRKHPEIYKKFDKKPGGGILLYGPPGTGKTMVARATAGEVGAKFFSVLCSDVLSKWFGDAEKNVRNLFDEAREAGAAVIFFDEFEAIGSTRDRADPAMQRLIPELLAQMDGFKTYDGALLVMAATNKPWLLDSAFLRPGRFAEKIFVTLPDEAARRYMFERNLGGLPLTGDVDFSALVRRTEGFSGADIKEICEQSKQPAIKRAIENGLDEYAAITAEDIDGVLRDYSPSVSRAELALMEKFRAEYEGQGL